MEGVKVVALNETVVSLQSSVNHRFAIKIKMSSNNSENPAKRARIEKNSETEYDGNEYVDCNSGQIIGSYIIQKKIGEGAFGRVVHATNLISGKSAALKIIKNDKSKRKVAMAEIVALRTISCRDPNDESLCIKMLDYFNNDTYLCIVFPVLGLSVFDFLKENNFEPFPMDQVLHISHQLCYAVDFLHRNRMTHTDLKPENMLFVNSTYTTVKDPETNCDVRRISCTDIRLIDFGLLTRDKDPHRSVVSTRYYRAPEVILNLGWSHPCDVWSIGCILVDIYFGNLLFDTHDDREHLAIMEKTLGPIPLAMTNLTKTKYFSNGMLDWSWQGMDKEVAVYFMPLKDYKLADSDDDTQLFDLIEKMLEYEPTKRILLSEALPHPFFNKLPTHQRVDNRKQSS